MKIDLILIGNQGAGKTSLIKRFLFNDLDSQNSQDVFTHTYTPTLGINLDKKDMTMRDKKINLCIWDTAGQEKFFALTKSYFQRADGVIIVFDITNEESFKKIEEFWLDQIKDKMDRDVSVIIVGNKVDLYPERNVKFVEAHTLASKYKIPYFETSAKNGECIDDAFKKIISMSLDSLEKQQETLTNSNHILKPPTTKDPKRKCFEKLQNYFDGISKFFRFGGSPSQKGGKEKTDEGEN